MHIGIMHWVFLGVLAGLASTVEGSPLAVPLIVHATGPPHCFHTCQIVLHTKHAPRSRAKLQRVNTVWHVPGGVPGQNIAADEPWNVTIDCPGSACRSADVISHALHDRESRSGGYPGTLLSVRVAVDDGSGPGTGPAQDVAAEPEAQAALEPKEPNLQCRPPPLVLISACMVVLAASGMALLAFSVSRC